MIQNPIINEKLIEKCGDDKIMFSFITDLMNNESEGKHFSKYYKAEIEKNSIKHKQIGGNKK